MINRAIILRNGDARRRHEFIQNPLQALGVETMLINRSKVFQSILSTLRETRNQRQGMVFFVVGVGLSVLPHLMICRLRHVTVVLRLGGNPTRNFESRKQRPIGLRSFFQHGAQKLQVASKRWVLSRADHVIVLSKQHEVEIRQLLSETARTYIIPQFLRLPDELGNSPRVPSAPFGLISVSNFEFRDKAQGVLKLVSYLSSAKERLEVDFDMTIVGGGSYLDWLTSECRRICEDTSWLNFVGWQSEVPSLLERADLFLYCSELDGVPNVLLEAKWCGLPILVNDAQIFADLATSSNGGLRFSDERDFEKKLSCLLSNPSELRQMGGLSRQHAREQFSIGRAVLDFRVLMKSLGGEN